MHFPSKLLERIGSVCDIDCVEFVAAHQEERSVSILLNQSDCLSFSHFDKRRGLTYLKGQAIGLPEGNQEKSWHTVSYHGVSLGVIKMLI